MSKFATKSPKASCFSVVDNHGKTNVALTYSKWPALKLFLIMLIMLIMLIFSIIIIIINEVHLDFIGRCGGLVVSTLDSSLKVWGLRPGWVIALCS